MESYFDDYTEGDTLEDEDDIDVTRRKGMDDRGEKNCHGTSGDGRSKQGNGGELHSNNGHYEDEQGKAASELRLTIRTLWKTGLEVFIHQLLYRRRIYPRDTFCSTRFVGTECKINNNPGVLIYIAEALKEIIPAIFGNDNQKSSNGRRRLNELLIEIYDQATDITYEQFSLSFLVPNDGKDSIADDMMTAGLDTSESNSDLSDYVIEEVERELRDLVCSTGKLERPLSLVWKDSVSFKILLTFNGRNNRCDSISVSDGGLDGTKWSKTTSPSSHRTGKRVLHNLSSFPCQFQYRLASSGDKIAAEKPH